ncbi:MAG: HDIG domain-containing protein [Acidimicrobiia bacterium]|nr:HDIG domain-containing protein [Acidimicrobiia bacterium]
MNESTRRSGTIIAGLVATVLAVAMALVVGRPAAEPAVRLEVGDIATEDFVATRYTELVDAAATQLARDEAADAVAAVFEIDQDVRSRVEQRIGLLFAAVRDAPAPVGLTLSHEIGAVQPSAVGNVFTVEYTVTVTNPASTRSSYRLEHSPLLSPAAQVLAATATSELSIGDPEEVELDPTTLPWALTGDDRLQEIQPSSSDVYTVRVRFSVNADQVTDANADCSSGDGERNTGLRGEARVIVDPNSADAVTCTQLPVVAVPAPPAGEGEATTTSSTTTTTVAPSTSTTTTIPVALQIDTLVGEYGSLYADAIPVLVTLYADHLADMANGGPGFFDSVEQEVIDLAGERMTAGIRADELRDVQIGLTAAPPPLFVQGLDQEARAMLSTAGADVVALSLEANEIENRQATEQARQMAADGVADITRDWVPAEPIVTAGSPIDAVQLEAITANGLLDPEPGTSRVAAAALGGLAVLMAALFLWRITPARWSQPKHIFILGILLLIAALVSRVPQLLGSESPQLAYILPASLLGYASAILYDPRTALLTAVPMALFVAISTLDPALTVFAAAATVTPIAFVSAVSTRRELRLAVLLGAAVLAPLAYTIAWMFDGRSAAVPAALAGFIGGVIGGFVGQGLVSFLENLFQLTTTVTLLDLTDRNHPALRLIEERAPGTFNHSILVGNLAGKAARAIGADPLFAQAAAFYHDLGKTENPQYFIENQFGVSNPHDELDPVQSAELIRRHVADGLRLARRYRIPPEIAAAVEQHHGTGVMRYFYHKAAENDPSLDPALFRHTGVRPQRKEMAILMISDAVEGATRAMAQHEDPTSESLRKVVDSVVGEKLDDGQFDESDLTFGDLTRVKEALLIALIGYYHTRIPYPGFPGTPVGAA